MSSPQQGAVGVVAPAYTWGRAYASWQPLANPAAGVAAKYTVPGSAFQRVVTAYMTLTTSAAVANRLPRITVINGDGVTVARFASSTAVVASTSINFTWAVNQGDHNFVAAGDAYASLPDLILPPGFAVVVDAAGLDVADQLTNVSVMLDWWWTGPAGPPSQTRPLAASAGRYGLGSNTAPGAPPA